MTKFRLKLSAILLKTHLNTARLSPKEYDVVSSEESSDPDRRIRLSEAEKVVYNLLSQPTTYSAREISLGIANFISSITEQDTLW